ncbi:MAG TPA: aspartate--tRNA(Asn) ligase [Promineifilum sp.]|nr:aspartate--tRNA(Asn) ligase [Promineifilum sp.]HRO89895.1 aspartate--tRNA(Asn) ligase [Promineifilum sp.]HRQ12722.1 aspartate--tRNA(Asn) ligase [Promineifilum sp.]
MTEIRTIEAKNHIGEAVQLKGWLHNVRRLGGVNFIVLRDGWGTIQAVTEDDADLAPIADLALGTVIRLEGLAIANAQAPNGLELQRPRIEVITPVTETPPLPLNKRRLNAALPTLLDHAVVANRHPARRAIFRLSSGVMAGFRATLGAMYFTEVQTPKIVASATESGANVFRLDYFGRPAYLAQSPQFYKQIMVGVFERVFEVGPVFRAEPHDTVRHINEYVSLDVEFGFIENHFTVMRLLREVIAGIFTYLIDNYPDDLALLEANLPIILPEIPHIHFADAQELILSRHGVDVRGEPDLSPQDERWLGEWALETHGSDFLFVTGYPMVKRPFYTHPDPTRPDYSNSFDLLFRGTELVTGGQRLHRYQDYLAALDRAGYPHEPFETYLEAFRYGMPPHGGFAIGLERLLMQLLGLPNLRLATLFPRDLHRVTP